LQKIRRHAASFPNLFATELTWVEVATLVDLNRLLFGVQF
jgi:hypothetical protein